MIPKISFSKTKSATRKVKKEPKKIAWNRLFRRIGLVVLVAAFLAFFGWAWSNVNDPSKFPIKVIRITGNYALVDKIKLKKIVSAYGQSSFFNVKLTSMQADLQKLPWVASVSIHRQWPAMLLLEIIEKKPVARWGNTGLLVASGKVFYPQVIAVNMQDLPLFKGQAGQQALMLKELVSLQQLLSPLGLTIKELDLSPRQAWTLTLSNGIELVVGKQDIAGRITRFVEAYPTLFANPVKQVVYVDLRYTNGMAVRWKT